MAFFLAIITAYLIGSFPTSFILAKALKGIDIRQVGSGNAGATNVLRSVGKIPAIITLIVDIFKGAFVVFFIAQIFRPLVGNIDYEFFKVILGLVVICGHIWPVFLGFKGGKGVATTLGTLGALAPISMLLPGLAIWLLVFISSKYVSLASLIMGLSFPVSAWLSHQPNYMIVFALTLCMINTYKHKSNIKRLLNGTENKTTFRKKS